MLTGLWLCDPQNPAVCASSIDDWIDTFLVQPAIMAQPGQAGYTTDRATMIASWTSLISGMCALNPWRCSGYDVASLISSGVDQVLATRSSGVASSGGGTYYPGANVSCGPGYVLGADGSCVPGSAPGNTLNTVVPTSTPIQVVSTANVLSAPTGQTPVTQQQLANTTNQGINTGIFAGANAGPVPIPSDITTWVETNWPLLAAGAAALFLLSTMRK